VFSCSKIEQKQLNTWVSFQSAEQPLLGQFSVSGNNPIAQSQRWVTIHRLDTDGDMEWEKVMELLVETPELDMTFNDDDSVTVRWEPQSAEDRDDLMVDKDWEEEKQEEEAPF